IQLPAGEELQEHQVHERAYLIVVDGEIAVSQNGQSVTGGNGLLSHFEPNERHAVKAISDARLLLVLSPWPGGGHPSRLRYAPRVRPDGRGKSCTPVAPGGGVRGLPARARTILQRLASPARGVAFSEPAQARARNQRLRSGGAGGGPTGRGVRAGA